VLPEGRRIKLLLKMVIAMPNGREAPLALVRHTQVWLCYHADTRRVDLCWQPKFQDLGDHIVSWK